MFRVICADVIRFFRHSSEVFCECFSKWMGIFTKNVVIHINKLYFYKMLDYLLIYENNISYISIWITANTGAENSFG